MEQVAQRSCGCLIIRSVQSQVGQGSEQPDLVKDSVGWLGLYDLQRSLLQPKPFYISTISCWITSFLNEGFFLLLPESSYSSLQVRLAFWEVLRQTECNELHSLHSAEENQHGFHSALFAQNYIAKNKTAVHCCT